MPGHCRRESVGGLARVAAQYRQVGQGLTGKLSMAHVVVAGHEWRFIVRAEVREVVIGGTHVRTHE
ncbi:MAG: hypothetical protein ACRDTH_19475 [Pseudonocardiaceae bacterium]